ncbi:MAG TPA: oxygen-independent coproporphyrinogen III oxidase [Steroidobacteraceae bacterium]|nr:oxygen-independent coproporphyrinogen III oxidase [Steroidobacteraceae bacterium]
MNSAFSSLLAKYNVPGPRYTSYPTVPCWEDTPTEAEWIEALRGALMQSAGSRTGAALYVHIPFCRSLCTYCGCNVRITRNRAIAAPYLETVRSEWNLYLDRLGVEKLDIAEIHLGGGTPTFLDPDELRFLMDGLLARSSLVADAEFSVEADPRVTTHEQLATLYATGFRRLSLGIQDFDPRVQDIVNRVQSEEQVRELTEQARELGFTSINYDLIYGLPLQTLQSIETTLAAVQRLRPDRIAFYAYAHVPWIKPSQRRFTEADLPQGEAKRALYERGREILESAGYREIGMDHFALDRDALSCAVRNATLHRSFMGYTSRHVAPLIGLGVSAIGDAWTAFMQNEKAVEPYQERIRRGELPILRGHLLDAEDLLLRRLILELMTRFRTRWDGLATDHEPLRSLPQRLHELIEDELVRLDGESCEVTERGRAFIRNVCMAFDARLARKAPHVQLFSSTV